MPCPEVPIQQIFGTECIGDSLPKINNNFTALGDATCDLITKVTNLSANPFNIVDSPTVDLSWDASARTLSADVKDVFNVVDSSTIDLNWNATTRTLSASLIGVTALAETAYAEHGRYAVIKNNRFYLWSENYSDMLGNGDAGVPEFTPDIAQIIPFRDDNDEDYLRLNPSVTISKSIIQIRFLMVLLSDGTVWLNGRDVNAGVNSPDTNSFTRCFRRVKFSDSPVIKDISFSTSSDTGYQFFGALSTTNNGYLWGYNADRQLNTGTNVAINTPTKITTTGIINNVRQIQCSGGGAADSVSIVTLDGNLFCCGYNAYGQFGIGSTSTPQSTFVQSKINSTTFLTGVSAIYGKNYTSRTNLYALKTDGTVWGAGDNASYQLGNGTTTDSTYFTQIGPGVLTNIVKLATCGHNGNITVLALGSTGNVYGWGYNGYGQLGRGNTANVTSPTLIDTGCSNIFVSSGANTGTATAYIKAGKIYFAGYTAHTDDKLGFGNTSQTSYKPACIPSDVVDCADSGFGGNSHNRIVLTNTGEVWGWGISHGGSLIPQQNEAVGHPMLIRI